ncbi:MAG TPA: MerR family transcriptional regulator [Candidatus Limnocylindrales bacterium]|nr:MerR family transcriptional regulator [Candidatus Limnocylindrales bacterium]
MALIGIGDAARTLGLNTSALRYYEERGLVTPVARVGGKRMYDAEQLRRLALVQLLHQLGIGLDVAAAILERPSDEWRDTVRRQAEHLDALIERATMARDFLTHAMRCPAEHPVRECPKLIEGLRRRLSGETYEQLAAEYGRRTEG